MARVHRLRWICGVFLFFAATATSWCAQTFTTLASFDGFKGGSPQITVLVQGFDGNFFGTTFEGGSGHESPCGGDSGCGTIFAVTPTGEFALLYNFCSQTNCADGRGPRGSLVQATNGDLYGTTTGGGSYDSGTGVFGGTVFKITPERTLTTLYSFCSLLTIHGGCADGAYPESALIQASDGNFYGTTRYSGPNNGGTVFKITPEAALTTLYSFCSQPSCADGENPLGGLVQATNGNFYGTTEYGGAQDGGSVFEITPAGKLTTIYSFCSLANCADGVVPFGALIQGSDGNFYGTTEGGARNDGTVFKITPVGMLTTVYTFCSLPNCADGAVPFGPLVQGSDGNFYGTTYEAGANGGGTVFNLSAEGTLTTLYNFCALPDCADGSLPDAGLLEATDGIFYGTTEQGGASNDGTVFSLATGLGPFVSLVHNPAKIGQGFGILGQGLSSTTTVLLNGIPASFTVKSDTLLTATVPAGATTGYVTVSTPGGTLTSNVPIDVLP